MSPTHYSLTFSLLAHALLLIPVVAALPDGSDLSDTAPNSIKVTIQRPATKPTASPATASPRATESEREHSAVKISKKVDAYPSAVTEKHRMQRVKNSPIKSVRRVVTAKDASHSRRSTLHPTSSETAKKPAPEKRHDNRLAKTVTDKRISSSPTRPTSAKLSSAPVQPKTATVPTVTETAAINTINKLPTTASGNLRKNSPSNRHQIDRIAEIESLYRARLVQTIASAKKYPLWARKKGLQGKARIGFTVYRDGHIEQIQLIDGSGHEILDRAAMITVSEIGSVQPIPTELARLQWSFKVPLNFYLN
ncbi:MAG: energy transducer TonB [Candidatus Sedimenticola sp. (ex Thyasira tokunagai)]